MSKNASRIFISNTKCPCKSKHFLPISNEGAWQLFLGQGKRKQCGQAVRTLALSSGLPGFKTHSDHSLNLFPVIRGSTSRPKFLIAKCFASSQLGFLTVVFVVFRRFVD